VTSLVLTGMAATRSSEGFQSVWVLLFVLLPCVSVLTAGYLVSMALLAREQRAVEATILLAELHAAHETIPLNEERRERELSQLRTMWALS